MIARSAELGEVSPKQQPAHRLGAVPHIAANEIGLCGGGGVRRDILRLVWRLEVFIQQAFDQGDWILSARLTASSGCHPTRNTVVQSSAHAGCAQLADEYH
ncbi:MAG: hypothetical protein ACKV19_01545 [Verrucomicrobiales bacterium]